MDIQLVPCEYIFPSMMFTVINLDNFQNNSVVHGMNTRAKNELHRSTVNLLMYKKGSLLL